MKTIVDLGGVGHYKNGTITVNIDPESGADIICDITAKADELSKHFEPGSVHMFTCIHTLEHLDPWVALDSMKYWRTFLEPRGRLLIVIPDLEQVMKDMVSNKIVNDTAISIIFNKTQNEIVSQWQKHRWGWTKPTLARDMTLCGYIPVNPERPFVKDYIFDKQSLSNIEDVGKYTVPNLRLLGFNPE